MNNTFGERGDDVSRDAFLRALDAYASEELGGMRRGARWEDEVYKVIGALLDERLQFLFEGWRAFFLEASLAAGVTERPVAAIGVGTVTTDATVIASATHSDDTDVAEWTRGVMQGLVAFGGPVLAGQVLMIVWVLAMSISSDARQQVSELAGLIALALALAPAFRAAARRMDGKKDDDR